MGIRALTLFDWLGLVLFTRIATQVIFWNKVCCAAIFGHNAEAIYFFTKIPLFSLYALMGIVSTHYPCDISNCKLPHKPSLPAQQFSVFTRTSIFAKMGFLFHACYLNFQHTSESTQGTKILYIGPRVNCGLMVRYHAP